MIVSLHREIGAGTRDRVYSEVTSALYVGLYHDVFFSVNNPLTRLANDSVCISVYSALREEGVL